MPFATERIFLPRLKEERQQGQDYKTFYIDNLTLGTISLGVWRYEAFLVACTTLCKENCKSFSSNSFNCRRMPFATERIFLPRLKEERRLGRQCKTFDIDNLTLGTINLGVWHYETFLAACTTTR